MKSLIKKLDFLGRPISFEIENSSTFQSFFGVIFSILVFVTALVLTFLFGSEVYKRKNPNIFISEQFKNEVQTNLLDFPFFIGFFDVYGNPIYDYKSYFDIYPEIAEVDLNGNFTLNKNLTYVPCKNINFTKHDNIIKKFIEVDKGHSCLNATENSIVKGKFPVRDSKQLRVSVHFCDPKLRSTCKFDLKLLLRQPALQIYYLNNIVDSENLKEPIKYFVDSNLVGLNSGIVKSYDYIFSQDTFISDEGWLLESTSKENFIKFKTNAMSLNLAPEQIEGYFNKRSVAYFTMKFSNTITITRRNYLKVQELFARVGGVVNAIMIITKCITYIYIKYLYLKFISDKIITNTENSKEPKMKVNSDIEVSKFNSSQVNLSRLGLNVVTSMNKSSQNNLGLEIKKEEKIVEEIIEQDHTIHDFGFLDYLIYISCCCCKFSRKTEMEKQISYINKFTDFSIIINMISNQILTTKSKFKR